MGRSVAEVASSALITGAASIPGPRFTSLMFTLCRHWDGQWWRLAALNSLNDSDFFSLSRTAPKLDACWWVLLCSTQIFALDTHFPGLSCLFYRLSWPWSSKLPPSDHWPITRGICTCSWAHIYPLFWLLLFPCKVDKKVDTQQDGLVTGGCPISAALKDHS